MLFKDFRKLRKRAREARKRTGAPAGHASSEPEQPVEEKPQRSTPARGILVIDSDPAARESLSESLQSDEHAVFTASDPEESAELALRELPRIVVLDWDLPDGQGLKLLKSLRETKEGQRMYFVTTSADQEPDVECAAFDAGANDHLTKPFNPRVLLARIQAANTVIQLQDQEERERAEDVE